MQAAAPPTPHLTGHAPEATSALCWLFVVPRFFRLLIYKHVFPQIQGLFCMLRTYQYIDGTPLYMFFNNLLFLGQ